MGLLDETYLTQCSILRKEVARLQEEHEKFELCGTCNAYQRDYEDAECRRDKGPTDAAIFAVSELEGCRYKALGEESRWKPYWEPL